MQQKVGVGVGTYAMYTLGMLVAAIQRRALWFLIPGVIAGLCCGQAPANPYMVITNRNAFGLQPEQPLPKPEELRPPPAKVRLEGIMSLMGTKRAILRLLKQGVPPGQEPVLMLAEGERDQDVEVVSIDEENNTVKIRNQGVVMDITFEKERPGLGGGGPAPAAVPAAPQLRPGFGGTPTPQLGPPPQAPTAVPVPAPAQPAGQPAQSQPQPAMSMVPAATPQRDVRTAERPLTYEEQVILIELERERTKPLVQAGEMPPLPPTELTPPEEAPIVPVPELPQAPFPQ